jgi:hypothetical protein
MARIIPSDDGPRLGAAGLERGFAARLARELGPDWTIHPDVTVASAGASAHVDFVLVGSGSGVALVGLVDAAAKAVAHEDTAALFAAMLRDEGFAALYRGELPVVALTVGREQMGELRRIVDAALAAQPRLTLRGSDWAEWIRRRLAASEGRREVAISGMARLRPPERDDSWRIEKQPGTSASVPPLGVAVLPEDHVETKMPVAGRTLWAGMALAVGVVAVVLAGMAALSHGNGPGQRPQSQAQSPE